MYPGPLDVLHYAGNENRLPVTDGIYLALFALEIFVNQHRVLGIQFYGHIHIAGQFGFFMDDFHRPSAEDIAGTDHYRITDAPGDVERPVDCSHAGTGRLGNAQPAEEIFKPPPVAGQVDGIGAGAYNRHAGTGQRLGEVYCRLSAELHNRGRYCIGSLVLQDVPQALFIQGFEVETAAGIEIGGYRFRVGVDHDALVTGFL